MPTKITMRMVQSTTVSSEAPQVRVAGWTESVWTTEENTVTALANALATRPGGGSLGQRRASLLANNAAVVEIIARTFAVSANGRVMGKSASLSEGVEFPGSSGPCDRPQVALLLKMAHGGAQPGVSNYFLHALPDERVRGGEFEKGTTYKTRVEDFMKFLAEAGYGNLIISRNPADITSRKIIEINPIPGGETSEILLDGNGTMPAGATQYLKVINSTGDCNRRHGAIVYVDSVEGTNQTMVVVGWPHGATKGGSCFRFIKTFAPFATVPPSYLDRVIRRKVGKPPGQYKGKNNKAR